MSENGSESWLDRPIIPGVRLNREQGLYLLILLLCLVSRLWMLGYRVQSHDESLHTKFSWDLYAGNGFQHNPMMHGPADFHLVAFSYFLFGDNDFTARLPIAIMGTALTVVLPYMFRRYLGRTGALATSFLLLISPAITYYSRYIRHDIPAALWATLMVWAIFRYLEDGRDRHLYVLAGALSMMFATKEVAFIYTAIFWLFLAGLFLLQSLRQRWERPAAEAAFPVAVAILALGLMATLVGRLVPLPPQAGSAVGTAGLVVAAVAAVAAVILLLYGLGSQRLRQSRAFDLMMLIGTLILPFASPLPARAAARLAAVVVGVSPTAAVSPFWTDLASLNVLDYTAPAIYYTGAALALMLMLAVLIGLLWDWRRWPIAVAIYMVIFLVFFTTVFTNGSGIASGWVGSLGYWLEQQGVQRGTQPWFYYLVITPMYEFLPMLGLLVAPLYLAVRGVVGWLRRRAADGETATPTLPGVQSLFIPFLLFWAVLSWFGYSYAGEKMPWLVVHITLPMILLTGWLVGRLLERMDWRGVWARQGWLMTLLLPALVATLAALFNSVGQHPFGGVELSQLMVTGTFLGALVGVGLLGALVAWLWRRTGGVTGLLLVVCTGLLVLTLLTVRIAYRLSFINFDRPAEFLVYAHEGPDVRTTMEQLEELSLRVGGGPQMIDVTYGPDAAWPFSWYLRDYPNARYYSTDPTRDQVVATAVLAGSKDWSAVEPLLGDDYYIFTYTYLWWPMEDYRQLTPQRLWHWLTDSDRRRALWRIFYAMDYRQYDEITDENHSPDDWPLHWEYRLYVRKDVADRLWGFGVGAAPEGPAELPPLTDPYAGAWQPLTASRMWGSEGSGPGQFSWPRGIAVSADGFVYVTDSRNNRIQKFTADGLFVTAWGSSGDCGQGIPAPGTFCDPWGVAVAPDGTVYVADTWAHRIQHFTADGEFLGQWGTYGEAGPDDPSGQGLFYGPRALAVADDGSVYVSDTGNKRVQVFTADGQFLRQWGGAGASPGRLNEPVGLAFNPAGQVVIADSWNLRMQVLESDGEPVLEWPISGWNNPGAEEKPYVAVDEEGRVYVTDPGHYRVLVFDSAGTYLYSFGQRGSDAASFNLPMGLALGPNGDLYVTDAANHRVMVFALPR